MLYYDVLHKLLELCAIDYIIIYNYTELYKLIQIHIVKDYLTSLFNCVSCFARYEQDALRNVQQIYERKYGRIEESLWSKPFVKAVWFALLTRTTKLLALMKA